MAFVFAFLIYVTLRKNWKIYMEKNILLDMKNTKVTENELNTTKTRAVLIYLLRDCKVHMAK